MQNFDTKPGITVGCLVVFKVTHRDALIDGYNNTCTHPQFAAGGLWRYRVRARSVFSQLRGLTQVKGLPSSLEIPRSCRDF